MKSQKVSAQIRGLENAFPPKLLNAIFRSTAQLQLEISHEAFHKVHSQLPVKCFTETQWACKIGFLWVAANCGDLFISVWSLCTVGRRLHHCFLFWCEVNSITSSHTLFHTLLFMFSKGELKMCKEQNSNFINITISAFYQKGGKMGSQLSNIRLLGLNNFVSQCTQMFAIINKCLPGPPSTY